MNIYYYIGLLVLNLTAKLMCDRKAFKEGGVESSDKGWLMKGMLSFLLGKWHFFDAVRNMSLILIAVIALGLAWYWCIVGYAIYGLLFNVFYKL